MEFKKCVVNILVTKLKIKLRDRKKREQKYLLVINSFRGKLKIKMYLIFFLRKEK